MAVSVQGLRELNRDLLKLGIDVQDLKEVYAAIAAEAAQIAAAAAPVLSGLLQASIRGNRAKGKAVVMAGRARVPYAAAINYGWARRNIAPANFMGAADAEMETRAPELLEAGLDDLFSRNGFTE